MTGRAVYIASSESCKPKIFVRFWNKVAKETNIFEIINQISFTVTTKTWVLLTEWTRTWPSIGIRMKKWRWVQFVWIVNVVLQSAWVLCRINKDEGDESLTLLAFRWHVVNAIFLKYSKESRLSSSHLGIQNIPSDVCYDDKNYYQAQAEHRRIPNPFKHLREIVFDKTGDRLKSLTGYDKILHLRCLKGFWIRLCIKTRHVQVVQKELSMPWN